jgi:hypothetical protein
MRLIATLLIAGVSVCHAAENPAARWEGSAQIPGWDLPLVIDLAQDNKGAWTGSIIVPGLNIKGATLTEITFRNSKLSFAVKDALNDPKLGPAKFKARLTPKGTLTGDFLQAGNSAPFVLTRTGPPQVNLPKQSTPLGDDLEGEWKGQYELGGYPRDVTLKLSRTADGAPIVDFVIMGKKVNQISVDLVTRDGDFLTIVSNAFFITYEGRLRKESHEMTGVFAQGPYEAPLNLRRSQ